jgi:hypothetical protein
MRIFSQHCGFYLPFITTLVTQWSLAHCSVSKEERQYTHAHTLPFKTITTVIKYTKNKKQTTKQTHMLLPYDHVPCWCTYQCHNVDIQKLNVFRLCMDREHTFPQICVPTPHLMPFFSSILQESFMYWKVRGMQFEELETEKINID